MPRLFRTHLCTVAERLILREGWFCHTGGDWEASTSLQVKRGENEASGYGGGGLGYGKETSSTGYLADVA